jgi:hypothetical protein
VIVSTPVAGCVIELMVRFSVGSGADVSLASGSSVTVEFLKAVKVSVTAVGASLTLVTLTVIVPTAVWPRPSLIVYVNDFAP